MAFSSSSQDDDSFPSPHEIFQSEWLISRILSMTDPRTTCLLALVSTTFLAASNSDLAWTPFLPPNSLPRLLQSDDHASAIPTSKKQAFLRLTRSIILRDGTQRYWLDRGTGAECFMLSARALQIIWGEDPRYWQWIPSDGAWFPDQVAYLRAVCWFQIRGTFREELRPGRYTISFRIKTNVDKSESYLDAPFLPRRPIWRRAWRHQLDQPHRRVNLWGNAPAKVSLRTSLGEEVMREVRLGEEGCLEKSLSPVFSPLSEVAMDDWMECHVGEFVVNHDDDDEDGVGRFVEIEFAMEEIEVLGWKEGVLVDGVMLRPSFCVPPPRQVPQALEEELPGDVSMPQMQHEHDKQEEMCQTPDQVEMCGVPSIGSFKHVHLCNAQDQALVFDVDSNANFLDQEEVCSTSQANAQEQDEMILQGPNTHEQEEVFEQTTQSESTS